MSSLETSGCDRPISGIFFAQISPCPGKTEEVKATHSKAMRVKIKPCLALTAISIFSVTGYTFAATKQNTVPYPQQVAQNFLNACTQSAPKSLCECTFKKIEQRYTLQEFTQIDTQASAGQPLPQEIVNLIGSCKASNR